MNRSDAIKLADFIGYTTGLNCNTAKKRGFLAKVEFRRNKNGSVSLVPVSGRNLEQIGAPVTVSADTFTNRPYDYYDDVIEARWALNLVGFDIAGDSVE